MAVKHLWAVCQNARAHLHRDRARWPCGGPAWAPVCQSLWVTFPGVQEPARGVTVPRAQPPSPLPPRVPASTHCPSLGSS